MKTPPRPDDPLLQALTSDANELPLAAAAQARSRQRLRRTVSSGAAVVVLVTLGLWFSTRPSPNHAGHTGPSQNFAQSGAILPRPVASPAEKKLLDDLADTPVLVVRNNSGHLRRVYILEAARGMPPAH